MNDDMDFNEPAFVARVQAWAAERRVMDRAPSRLVDAVMDDVAATPRRTPWFGRLPLRGVAGYAALTAAITVGVTFGILLASRLTPDVGPSQSPTVSTPSPTPAGSVVAPLGSPTVLATLSDVPFAATAIAASGDSVWAADGRNGTLAELDPVTGDIVRSVELPRPVHGLLVTSDTVWAASRDGSLLRVARLDLTVTEVPDTAGQALAAGPGVVWLGGSDEVVRIDVATNTVTLRVPVGNRGPELGVAADAASVWIATRTEILRVDATIGTTTARIQGDANSLALVDGTLWATRGTELLRIDPIEAQVLEYIAGLSDSGPIATESGVLWLGGGSGPSIVQGWTLASGRLAYLAEVASRANGLALTSDTIWIATNEGDVIYRFRLP